MTHLNRFQTLAFSAGFIAVAAVTLLAFGITSSLSPAWAAKVKTCAEGNAIECIQDTLGPVPVAPEDQDIQQRLDAQDEKIDDILALLCSSDDPSAAPYGICTRIAFLTSTEHQGDLGGLAGGDDICNDRAQEAGLPGTYLAWLSDSTTEPNQRFTHSSFPYVRTDGVTVATDYTALTSGSLAAPIVLDENALTLLDALARTATTETGERVLGAGTFCAEWADATNTTQAPLGVTASLTDWSFAFSLSCALPAHLYCFQQ